MPALLERQEVLGLVVKLEWGVAFLASTRSPILIEEIFSSSEVDVISLCSDL